MKEKFIIAQSKANIIKIGEGLGLTFTRDQKRSINVMHDELSKFSYRQLVDALNK